MSELTDQIAQEWEAFEPTCPWRRPFPEAPGCGHMHCEFAHDLRVRANAIENPPAPVPRTKEEQIQFRKDWDARVEAGLNRNKKEQGSE